NVFRFDAQLFRELFHRRSFDQTHWLQLAGKSLQTSCDALFKRAHFGRRNEVAVHPAFAVGGAFAAAWRAASRATAACVRRRDVSSLRCGRFARRSSVLDTTNVTFARRR